MKQDNLFIKVIFFNLLVIYILKDVNLLLLGEYYGFQSIGWEESSIYVDKVKKQAKRLFQISKTTNNNLSIDNLSQAQQLLAKINGFPDWHALIKSVDGNVSNTIDNDFNSLDVATNISQTDISPSGREVKELDDIYYLENGSNYESLINLFWEQKIKSSEVILLVTSLMREFEFFMNAGGHKFEFSYTLSNDYKYQNSYYLLSVAEELNLSIQEVSDMFLVDVKNVNTSVIKSYFSLILQTENKEDFSLQEHIYLADKIKTFLTNYNKSELGTGKFTFIKHINDYEKLSIASTELKKDFKINYLLELPEKLNMLFSLIDFVKDKKIPTKILFNNSNVVCSSDKSNFMRIEKMVDALSITTNFMDKEIHTDEYFSKTTNPRNSLPGLVFEKHDSLKVVDSQLLNIEINKDSKNGGKALIVSDNKDSASKLTTLLATYPYFKASECEDKTLMIGNFKDIKYLEPLRRMGLVKEMDLDTSFLPDLLFLPIGVNKYSNSQIYTIGCILYRLLFNKDFPAFKEYMLILSTVMEKINNLEEKKYIINNQNEIIEKHIKNLNRDELTCNELSLILWSKGYKDEARDVKLMANYDIYELLSVFKSDEINKAFNYLMISSGKTLVDEIVNRFEYFLQNVVLFNKGIKKFYPNFYGNEKIYTLSLDMLYIPHLKDYAVYLQDYYLYVFNSLKKLSGSKTVVIENAHCTNCLISYASFQNKGLEPNMNIIVSLNNVDYENHHLISEFEQIITQKSLNGLKFNMDKDSNSIWLYSKNRTSANQLFYFK